MADMDSGKFGELLGPSLGRYFHREYKLGFTIPTGEYEKLFNVDGPPPVPPPWRQRLRWWWRDKRESLAYRIAPWLRYND